MILWPRLTSGLNDQRSPGKGNCFPRIYPRKQAADLGKDQLDALYDNLNDVCDTAIEKRIEWDEYPETYLTPRREEGTDCPLCDGTIRTMKINSRTCYYCPQHQED